MTIRGVLAARGQISGPLAVGAGGAALWYDPVGAFAAFRADIYAWRAINTPGSPWGAGPADYATSLVDENNSVVLTEGNGAVPWAGLTGWGFVQAAAKYFRSGIVPVADNSSMFIQFTGGVSNGADHCLAGLQDDGGANRIFYLFNSRAADQVLYANGGLLAAASRILTGNMGVAGNRGYRNGIIDVAGIAAWGSATTYQIFIGARNRFLAPGVYCTANIGAVWICLSNPAVVQANVVTLVAAMAAL